MSKDVRGLAPAGESGAAKERQRLWRITGRWFLRGLGVLAALGLLAGLAVWVMDARQAVLSVSQTLRAAKPLFVAIHLVLIGAVWWYWSPIVHWLKARGQVSEQSLPVAIALRHRLVGFLLAFEWLVVIRWPLGQW